MSSVRELFPEREIRATEVWRGVCPFCAEECSVCRRVSDGEPFVLHAEPPCSQFIAARPNAWVRALSETLADEITEAFIAAGGGIIDDE